MGQALENGDWESIRKDMNRVPVKGIDGEADQEKITGVLNKYGIQKQGDTVQIEIWGSGKPMREFMERRHGRCLCLFNGKQRF